MQEYELSRFLLILVLLLSASMLIGKIFQKLGLPKVVGEVISGILLGPSLLGHYYPALQAWIFDGSMIQSELLSVIYWLGLILLMFTSGFNFPKKIESINLVYISILVAGGIVLPFFGGIFFSLTLPSIDEVNPVAFYLVIGIATSVTSVPVLSRIFEENKLSSSEFAIRVLTSAAILDLILWMILSVSLNLQNNSEQNESLIQNLAILLPTTFIFTLLLLKFTPKVLSTVKFNVQSRDIDSSLIGLTLLVCMIIVTIGIFLQINIIFSALVAGAFIGGIKSDRMRVAKITISQFSNNFFVPIYFAIVGLRIDLRSSFDFSLFIKFLVITSILKILSVTLFANFITNNRMKSLDYGMTMNARGGPGIVLASLALEGKIIDENFFIIFILTSLVTSLISGIWIRYRNVSLQ